MGILAVTTQAHEGIETPRMNWTQPLCLPVTTQAHEGIETKVDSPYSDTDSVTTQAHEGIETLLQKRSLG